MASLTIHNLTDECLSCHSTGNNEKWSSIALLPCSVTSLSLANKIHRSTDRVILHQPDGKSYVVKLDKLKMDLGVSWNLLFNEGPWTIYRYRHGSQRLVILPKRNLSAFLSEMPDEMLLSSLLLPGTHDTMAFYGWPVSQCQSTDTPLSVQLKSGIRVIDVRLAVVKSRLIAYHGAFPERAPFQDILSTLYAFLTSPASSRETVVVSIKQEDFRDTPASVFSALVHEEIFSGPGGRAMWFLDNRVPKLGEVRGKVIMFSRFGGNGDGWEGGLEGLGIHPTMWPDSEMEGFSWRCKNTVVRTHDWYAIPSFLSIPEKVALSTRILLPPDPSNEPPTRTLSITFFSATSFPLALPSTVARGFGWPQLGFGLEGVNSRVGQWLLDTLSSSTRAVSDVKEHIAEVEEKGLADKARPSVEEPRIRGWTLMDFYADPFEHGVVPLLIECNYRGRRAGEEGWR